MSSAIGVYLLLVTTTLSTKVNCDNPCGFRTQFQEPKGRIETDPEIIHDDTNCMWTIVTPKHSVMYIKIEYLQLGSYDEKFEYQENCLYFTSLDKKVNYTQICSDVSYFDTLSIPTNELLISLKITSESYLSLTYSSYIVNCAYNELKCYNSRFYPKHTENICTDGMLVCRSLCKYGTIVCGDFCYDINKQRCDGIIDCPTAEDELGCNPEECPNQIRCSDEPKCLTSQQICDEKSDCKNGFDESNCPSFFCKEDEPNCNIDRIRENDPETADFTYIIAIVFAVMILLFIYLICRCLSRRDNIRSMLDNPLDVPLPPFRGPGESSSTTENVLYTDEDFRPGGDVFESFTANMEKIKNKRKNRTEDDEKDITFVKPSDGQNPIDKYFNGVKPVLSEELAALATLKITRDRCHGLRKTKSEERPMTRLLFIDNKDNGSDYSDTDDNDDTASNVKNTPYRTKHSKSDTDYVRRKGAGVSFV